LQQSNSAAESYELPAIHNAYTFVNAQLSDATGAIPFDAAKEPFKGQFIYYDDPHLTEVAKGYALQAAMYHVTKEAFCEDPECRLFNAHWQAEVLRAQIESGSLCHRHTRLASAISSVRRARKDDRR